MILTLLRQRRRRWLRARPFPEKWLTLIQGHVVFFRRLSASDRAELLGHIQVFLAEKRFEGCGGFAITDDHSPNFVRDALEFVTGMGGEWGRDGRWNWTDPKVVAALDLWRKLARDYSPKGTDINANTQSLKV